MSVNSHRAPRGTSIAWSRAGGVAALVAGVGLPPGISFGFGEHSTRHWQSHAGGIPAEVAAAFALAVLLVVRGHRMGWFARITAVGGALAFGVAAAGNALITYAATVQEVTDGGLYFVGHDVQSLALPLSTLALVGFAVTMLWSRAMPPGATWVLFAGIPLAAATGPLLHAMGNDGADGLLVALAMIDVLWIWWGIELLSAPSPATEPSPVSPSMHRQPAATASAK